MYEGYKDAVGVRRRARYRFGLCGGFRRSRTHRRLVSGVGTPIFRSFFGSHDGALGGLLYLRRRRAVQGDSREEDLAIGRRDRVGRGGGSVELYFFLPAFARGGARFRDNGGCAEDRRRGFMFQRRVGADRRRRRFGSGHLLRRVGVFRDDNERITHTRTKKS